MIPSISDTFRAITVEVSTELNRPVYFMQGSWEEVREVLQSMTQAQATADKKYPLVWLIRDIKEKNIYAVGDVYTDFDAWLLIATVTDKNYRADEREEKNFKGILHPIFEAIVRKVQNSNLFTQGRDFDIERTDNYRWGRQYADTQLTDYIDAVETKFFGLQLRKSIC